MSKLAIFGGEPIRKKLLPAQITIGVEEEAAVVKVMKNKLLSGFRGNASQAFYGGEEVIKFENRFITEHEEINHTAVAVNSCTSALQISCYAIGLKPGDEVIVTPWSMTCSATAPLICGALPVFADVEHEYFCLDPESIKQKITSRTKAIIIVDLFGQPFSSEIIDIAREHNLIIIEDAAQALGSKWAGAPAGFIGDIGCFSFTQGKHLTAGEGGMAVSRISKFAANLQLIRNHAEAVINDIELKGNNIYHPTDLIGFNMRMTEIQAAILSEQFKKLNKFVFNRQANASFFSNKLSSIPAIRPAKTRRYCSHSYYVQAFFWDKEKADGIPRDKYIAAVKAELKPQEGRADLGVPIGCGYIKPLYKMPLFRDRLHWALKDFDKNTHCPVVEKLWSEELFLTTMIGLDLQEEDREDIADAFIKVWENREELK